MAQSTYIKLTAGSLQNEISLNTVKELLESYIGITSKTGEQLNWHYTQAAFPYTITEHNEPPHLHLEGTDSDRYNQILIGTGEQGEEKTPFIQITLSNNSTHGDKSKANEYAKFMAKKLKGELHLFNQRVIFYNKQK